MPFKDRIRAAIHRSNTIGADGSNPGSRKGSIISSKNSTRPGTGTTTPTHDQSAHANGAVLSTSPPKHNGVNGAALQQTQTTNGTADTRNGHAAGGAPIALTKTTSRLTKTLTWGGSGKDKKDKSEAKKEKALDAWAKKDALEWTSPMDRRPGRKNQQCQDTLRAFDFNKLSATEPKWGERHESICSGISPNASRAASVVDVPPSDAAVEKNDTSAPKGEKKSVGEGRLAEVKRDDVKLSPTQGEKTQQLDFAKVNEQLASVKVA